jgi:prepilin-type N-terminal cleavage/methylation domain-containing protein
VRSRRGYTLLELAIVVAILAIVAAAAYPTMESMYADLQVSSAVDQVRAAWTSARVRAVDEGRPYRFAVVPGKGNFRIAPDSSEFWTGSGGSTANTGDNSTDKPLLFEDALPKGVAFAVADSAALAAIDDTKLPIGSVDPAQYSSVATFLPDGTSREDVRVIFSRKGVPPIVLRIRGITGAVTVRSLQDDMNSGQPAASGASSGQAGAGRSQ